MTIQDNELDLTLEALNPRKMGVHSLLLERTSRASFSPKDVDRQDLVRLLQAARCAPSSHNSQPWYFIVVSNGSGREEINQSITAAGADWATTAPILLAVVINLTESTRQNGLNYGLFDGGLAVQNILLQAASMGLSAHPFNYYCHDDMTRVLNLPRTHELILFIAIGWPTEQSMKTESSRLRKPLAAIASWDRWDGSPVLE